MTSDSIFALWPVLPFGADDEKENSNSGSNNSGQSGEQSNNQGGQSNSSSGSKKDDDDDADDPYKGLSAKELKKLLADAEANGTTAAEELETLRREKQEAEDAKLSADQLKDKRIADLEADVGNLRTALAKASIVNAINENKEYTWNSANIVAQQLDSEKVKVDDKGKVTGLEKELARIANDDNLKFLLASKNSEEKNNQQQQDQQQNNGVTGFQPGQGGASATGAIGGIDATQAAELAKKMPALAGRI